jgi:hypothetical protein
LAFSNSGIPAKLSEQQQNAFSAWMDAKSYIPAPPDGAEARRDCSDKEYNFILPDAFSVYSWDDKLGQSHSVTVKDVIVPQVSEFILQHTLYSYSRVKGILDRCNSDSNTAAGILQSLAVTEGIQAGSWATMAALSAVIVALRSCIWWPPCLAAYLSLCNFYVASRVALGILANATFTTILAVLTITSGVASGGTLYLLGNKNDEAFKGVSLDDNGILPPLQPSTTCDDAEDLLIVQFAGVTYPGDVSVTTIQEHPGTGTGIMQTNYPPVTSSATANYEGGDVGTFDKSYDAKLIEVN